MNYLLLNNKKNLKIKKFEKEITNSLRIHKYKYEERGPIIVMKIH